MRSIRSITDYGADPVKLDNRVAIQRAIKESSGDDLYFPKGVFRIKGPLYMSGIQRATFWGPGTIKRVVGSSALPGYALSLNVNSGTHCENIRINEITFEKSGVLVRSCHQLDIQCYVTDPPKYGISIENASDAHVHNCSITGKTMGKGIGSFTPDTYIRNNTIRGCGVGITSGVAAGDICENRIFPWPHGPVRVGLQLTGKPRWSYQLSIRDNGFDNISEAFMTSEYPLSSENVRVVGNKFLMAKTGAVLWHNIPVDETQQQFHLEGTGAVFSRTMRS